MKKRYYIAYGSNLNIRQMRMRCPSARIIGTSEIPDYELLFKGSKTGSYLTIEPKKGSWVPVAAWEVSAEDELALDRYEGFPIFYYKKEMLLPIKGIRSGKTRQRNTFVYIMHEDRPIGVPSDFYMETCLQGYHSFGFDKKFLIDAIENSRRKYCERNKYYPN
ncbi:MAG TPA: gamma-glutamylcyclotransferase [Sellimonas intestinalis]|nr:gamma-glutamylcyclotransferase [Sellimonas intestinalis]